MPSVVTLQLFSFANHFDAIRSIPIGIERARRSRKRFARIFFHMINERAERMFREVISTHHASFCTGAAGRD
jgi:hypothetical protein